MKAIDESTIYVFSKSKEGETQLTKNFKVKEFACSDGSDVIFIHPLIPVICQLVRNNFSMPFAPNSAYRTVTHNKKVGGVNDSNHAFGRAVDIPAKNVAPKKIYDFLDKIFGDWGELGLYSWGVHIGIQNKKERFIDSSYKG